MLRNDSMEDGFAYAIYPDPATGQAVYRVEREGIVTGFVLSVSENLDRQLDAARAYILGQLAGRAYLEAQSSEASPQAEPKTGKYDKAARDWFKGLGNSEATVARLLPKPASKTRPDNELRPYTVRAGTISADSLWTTGTTITGPIRVSLQGNSVGPIDWTTF